MSRCSKTWRVSGNVLPCKGTARPHCAEALVNVMLEHGFTRFICRSDNEPAILDLKARASALARERHGFDIVPESSPEGDSAANGLAEGSVRDVKAQVRTIRYAIEQLHN
eukprot:8288154-Lingulodinium_polyedra.AAC.1